jgi:hypothetical protein
MECKLAIRFTFVKNKCFSSIYQASNFLSFTLQIVKLFTVFNLRTFYYNFIVDVSVVP